MVIMATTVLYNISFALIIVQITESVTDWPEPVLVTPVITALIALNNIWFAQIIVLAMELVINLQECVHASMDISAWTALYFILFVQIIVQEMGSATGWLENVLVTPISMETTVL